MSHYRHTVTTVAAAASFMATPAMAQNPIELPAAILRGSCKPLNFDVSGIDVPDYFDVLVRVDQAGVPISARSLTSSNNSPLLEAVVALSLSCKYLPATTDGQPTPGLSRFTLPMRQAPGQRPGALPAIADLQGCAPTSRDYPTESRKKNETGTTRISFTTDSKGKLTAFGVAESSGHLLLDFTALVKLARCKFVPGKAADGTPIGGSFTVNYIWKLE